MFNIENFYFFLSVSILVNLSPGPDMLYTAARSLSQGTKAGIFSTLGIFTGCLFHITAAVFGLSKIIEESVLLFSIIKYAGAAYLVYLGLKSLLRKTKNETTIKELPALSSQKIFTQGLITNLLNPKVAIFFLSFLPQFINPEYAHGPLPFLILGFSFLTTGTLWCLVIAYSASFMTERLRRNERIARTMNKVCGMVFVALGLQLALKK